MAQDWVLELENQPSNSVVAAAGSKPAPKKDQIKGSDKNEKGSASGSKKVVFSKATENDLEFYKKKV